MAYQNSPSAASSRPGATSVRSAATRRAPVHVGRPGAATTGSAGSPVGPRVEAPDAARNAGASRACRASRSVLTLAATHRARPREDGRERRAPSSCRSGSGRRPPPTGPATRPAPAARNDRRGWRSRRGPVDPARGPGRRAGRRLFAGPSAHRGNRQRTFTTSPPGRRSRRQTLRRHRRRRHRRQRSRGTGATTPAGHSASSHRRVGIDETALHRAQQVLNEESSLPDLPQRASRAAAGGSTRPPSARATAVRWPRPPRRRAARRRPGSPSGKAGRVSQADLLRPRPPRPTGGPRAGGVRRRCRRHRHATASTTPVAIGRCQDQSGLLYTMVL